MELASAGEVQLVPDMLIEADCALHRLSDVEYRMRLGVGRGDRFINRWRSDESSVDLEVADVEVIRACWSEVLDFLSDAEFKLRTGWDKEEDRVLFQAFMKDRRELTVRRQWG